MSELSTFCYGASYRIIQALFQELQIVPKRHYTPSGYNSSRVMSFQLVGINPAYLPKVKRLQPQLTFWAGLTDEYQIRIGHNANSIIIEIPKPKRFWDRVTIEQLEAKHYIKPGPVATIGLGLQDEPKRVNFQESAMAHVFIAGQTRSGKTNTQKLIGWNLAHNTTPADARLIVFDVAKRGFKWSDFDNITHLMHPVIRNVTEADKVLSWLNLEIEKRATERYTRPRLFILIDELKALGDDSKVAMGYISRIASTGGEFGLHLVLSTQYPQIKLLGSSELKRNVTTRLCGRVDDSQAAVNALGIPDSGAETLQGYGDFLLKDFNGLSRLTVAHCQDKNISQLPRAEVQPLSLPDNDVVNNGATPTRKPEPIKPEQVALALFKPMSINRLQQELGIGGSKATRIKKFADRIRQWAIDNGYKCIDA